MSINDIILLKLTIFILKFLKTIEFSKNIKILKKFNEF